MAGTCRTSICRRDDRIQKYTNENFNETTTWEDFARQKGLSRQQTTYKALNKNDNDTIRSRKHDDIFGYFEFSQYWDSSLHYAHAACGRNNEPRASDRVRHGDAGWRCWRLAVWSSCCHLVVDCSPPSTRMLSGHEVLPPVRMSRSSFPALSSRATSDVAATNTQYVATSIC